VTPTLLPFGLALACLLPPASPLPIPDEREACGDIDGACAVWLASADPSDPLAEVALRRVNELCEGLARPASLLSDLDRLATGRTEAHAAGLLRKILLRVGRVEDAARIRFQKGHIATWWILGPLGSRRAAGIEGPFVLPPDLREGLELADGPFARRWRRIDLPRGQRGLAAGEHVHPDAGVVFALGEARIQGEARILVRSTESFRLWIDEMPIGVIDRALERRAGEVGWSIQARPGRHRILVLVPSSAVFAVRIESADGSLADLGDPPAAFPAPGPGLVADPRPIPDGGDAAAALAGDSAQLEAATAILLRAVGRPDLAVQAAERAIAAAPDDPHLAVLAAETILPADYLGRSHARNRARILAERALAARADHVPAALLRANLFAGDGEPEKAYRLLEEVLAKHPDAYRARLAIAEIASDRNWEREAIRHFAEADRIAPHPSATGFLAARARKRFAPVRAAEILRSRLAWDSREAIAEAASALAFIGRLADADAVLARASAAYGEDGDLLLARARIEERRPDADALAAVLRARIGLSPDDPGRWRDLAAALARCGREAEAREELARAQALAPGDRRVRRSIEIADGRPPADGAAPFEEEILAAYRGAGGPEDYPKCDAVALLDLAVLEVFADGSSRQTVHQAFKVLSEAGVEDQANVATPGEVLALRTITPAGEILEPTPGEGRGSWSMPGVRPGVAVDVRWRADRESPPRFQLAESTFYFQDPNAKDAFELSRCAAIFPAAFPLRSASRAGAGDPAVRRDGDLVVWVWEKRDMPRLEPEPNAPDAVEVYPNIELVEERSISEIGAALYATVAGRTLGSPELSAEAAKITAGVEDPLAKARAIHRFVCEEIKVESGPAGATAILQERAGDRRTLMKALLEAAGLDARWVFARPRPPIAPAPSPEIRKPGDWTSVLVELSIPGREPVYLAGSPRLLAFGQVPEMLSGGILLRPEPAGATLGRLPEIPIDELGESLRVEMEIGDEGGGKVRAEIVQRGSAVARIKETLRTTPEELRRTVFGQVANQIFPGGKVKEGAIQGLDDLGVPFGLTLSIELDRALLAGVPDPLLRAIPSPIRLAERYGTRDRRELALVIRAPLVTTFDGAFALGGREVAQAPRDRSFASQAGSYSLRFRIEERTLHVTRRLAILPCRIEPDAFAEFLGFCRDVDAADAERIPLRRR